MAVEIQTIWFGNPQDKPTDFPEGHTFINLFLKTDHRINITPGQQLEIKVPAGSTIQLIYVPGKIDATLCHSNNLYSSFDDESINLISGANTNILIPSESSVSNEWETHTFSAGNIGTRILALRQIDPNTDQVKDSDFIFVKVADPNQEEEPIVGIHVNSNSDDDD